MNSMIPIPVPDAVAVFKWLRTLEHIAEADLLMDDAERELRRPCDPLSVEDLGDRETALAMYAQADKVLSATAPRPIEPTAVLS